MPTCTYFTDNTFLFKWNFIILNLFLECYIKFNQLKTNFRKRNNFKNKPSSIIYYTI